MIDVRELQRRGVVRIPKKDIVVSTDDNGFVELGATSQNPQPETSSNAELFNMTPTENSFSTQSDGYNKREVDAKMTTLDNKIYKLEQRIELLERKLDVNKPSESSPGLIGW